ncbi:MAG TPA: polymer-forming cytoskeletal protein [Stellaceae bacterium]|nr:polymer-forming cytoskeletal protein [Stellaceae bacterium]
MPSIIGAGMVIHGDFKSGGALHVDGTVQGDIHVQSLTVGKEATIRGEISAEQVKVHGTVAGCIRAREVVLAASAKVQGDVHHDVLSIEAGATLEGHCRRRDGGKPDGGRDAASGAGANEPVRLTPKAPAEPPPLALAGGSRAAAKA